jgi:hypothetical protein
MLVAVGWTMFAVAWWKVGSEYLQKLNLRWYYGEKWHAETAMSAVLEGILYTWLSRRQVPPAAWGLGLRPCEYVGIISLYFNVMCRECAGLLRLSPWHEFEAILCCTMDERSLQG